MRNKLSNFTTACSHDRQQLLSSLPSVSLSNDTGYKHFVHN